MELALEFWSLPFRFLMNALANLLVFVADSHGASLGPPGRQMRDTGAHLGGRLAAPGRLQREDWVDTRPQGRLQGGDLSFLGINIVKFQFQEELLVRFEPEFSLYLF